MRGATAQTAPDLGAKIGISIHAPLAGCDDGTRAATCASRSFQSTHPLRGATLRQMYPERVRYISIHAPLAGCDPTSRPSSTTYSRFQSTHPLRGATSVDLRHPAALVPHFNPRTPCGVRLMIGLYAGLRREISIHAPLAGCDIQCVEHRLQGSFISIHAPLAGCDGHASVSPPSCALFQSTHPLRGATVVSNINVHAAANFNPRTPCGVRPDKAAAEKAAAENFNPRTPCGVRQQKRTKKCGTFVQKV